MFKIVLNLVASTIAVMIAAKLIPGVAVTGFTVAATLAVVLAIINTFIKPVIKLLAFPVNFATLGLFSLVINAFLIMLADSLVDGFSVPGFFEALIFGLVLGLINSILGGFKN